jgi:hypothetical protein
MAKSGGSALHVSLPLPRPWSTHSSPTSLHPGKFILGFLDASSQHRSSHPSAHCSVFLSNSTDKRDDQDWRLYPTLASFGPWSAAAMPVFSLTRMDWSVPRETQKLFSTISGVAERPTMQPALEAAPFQALSENLLRALLFLPGTPFSLLGSLCCGQGKSLCGGEGSQQPTNDRKAKQLTPPPTLHLK